MDGLKKDGRHRPLADEEYAFVAGLAHASLWRANPNSLNGRMPEDIECAKGVIYRCVAYRRHLRGVRLELGLSSSDEGYRLALVMFHKAHQTYARMRKAPDARS